MPRRRLPRNCGGARPRSLPRPRSPAAPQPRQCRCALLPPPPSLHVHSNRRNLASALNLAPLVPSSPSSKSLAAQAASWRAPTCRSRRHVGARTGPLPGLAPGPVPAGGPPADRQALSAQPSPPQRASCARARRGSGRARRVGTCSSATSGTASLLCWPSRVSSSGEATACGLTLRRCGAT